MTASTAAKRKGPGRPPANPEVDSIDLSALTFEVAPKPKRKGAGDNPFTDVLGESYETETARATKVPAAALRRVEGLLRRAAGDLEIGVSIAVDSDDKGEPIVDEDGKVTLTFMGKDRRKIKKKEDVATDVPTETSETGDAGEPDVLSAGTAGDSAASAESESPAA